MHEIMKAFILRTMQAQTSTYRLQLLRWQLSPDHSVSLRGDDAFPAAAQVFDSPSHMLSVPATTAGDICCIPALFLILAEPDLSMAEDAPIVQA